MTQKKEISMKTILGEYVVALERKKRIKIAFEKFIKERLGLSRNLEMIDDDHYSDGTVNLMWISWRKGMKFLNKELKYIISYYV